MELAVRNQQLTQRVGLVSLLVLSLLVVLLVLFDGCRLRAGFHVTVYFEHAGQLREGADVQVAGWIVGEIQSISLVPAGLAPEGHPLAGTGGVAARIRIEKRYAHMTPHNGELFVATKGLFGERYIEIGPPPGVEPRGRDLGEGDTVRGVDPPRLDRMMLQSYQNLIGARVFMQKIDPHVDELAGALEELGHNLGSVEPEPGAFADIGRGLSDLGNSGRTLLATWRAGGVSMADIEDTAAAARATLERTRATMTDIRSRAAVLVAELERARTQIDRGVSGGGPGSVQGGISDRLRAALARIDGSLAKLERIVATATELGAMLERGEGSLGAIMNDPEFPEDAKGLGRALKRHPWRLIGPPPAAERQ